MSVDLPGNKTHLAKSFTYKPSHTWWLLALLAFMLLFRLGAAPIYILDEAKNAQCAREMLQRNDWVVPTFNGELRTDKPVLHYYFMMTAYKMFGVSASSARLFSAIAGILTVAFTFLFARRFANKFTGIFAAIVLAASSHFLFEFRLSVPDPYLIFFITIGLLTAFTYLQQNKLVYVLIAAAAFGLATLAKGPVALALPGLCLFIWVFIKKKWKLVFSRKILLALIVLAVITLPWYLAVDEATNGAWTRGFFIDHNLNRFSDPQEGHGGLFVVTIAFVIIGLLPFIVFIGEVIKRRKAVFANDLVLFSGIVVLAFVVFFSISSTKLPNYPMPCYPFAAIIIGHFLSLLLKGETTSKKYPLYILIGFTALVAIGGFFAIAQEPAAASINWIALFLLVAPLALLVVSILWKNLGSYARIIWILAAYSIFNSMLLHFIYPTLYSQNPVTKTMRIVERHKEVYSYKKVSKEPYTIAKNNTFTIVNQEGEFYNPAYNFYLRKPVKKFTNIDSLQAALLVHPGAILITTKDTEEQLSRLGLIKVAEHHDLFENPTTVLYVSRH
jgi:4-amino-4-deoxy-L-arabinose transferase-like glycosyltransferase